MEILTIILSGLLSLIAPVGFVGDQIAAKAIRERFERVEQLQVRVDNAPSYQILQGKVEQIRIAGRGIWISENVRIAAVEVETDFVDVNLRKRQQGLPQLEQPFQAGVRVEITAGDINRLLRSQFARAQLQDLSADLLSEVEIEEARRYEFLDPRVEFLDNQRLRFQLDIQEVENESPDAAKYNRLSILGESGLIVLSGRRIRLLDPSVQVVRLDPDGNETRESVPSELLNAIATGIERTYDLKSLQKVGITARLLDLKIEPDKIGLAAFVKVEPTVNFSGR